MRTYLVMLALVVLAGCSSCVDSQYAEAKAYSKTLAQKYTDVYQELTGVEVSPEYTEKYSDIIFNQALKMVEEKVDSHDIDYIMKKLFNYSVINLAMGPDYIYSYLIDDSFELYEFMQTYYNDEDLPAPPTIEQVEYKMASDTADFIMKLGSHTEVQKNGSVYLIHEYTDSNNQTHTCNIKKGVPNVTDQGKGETVRDCITRGVLYWFLPAIEI